MVLIGVKQCIFSEPANSRSPATSVNILYVSFDTVFLCTDCTFSAAEQLRLYITLMCTQSLVETELSFSVLDGTDIKVRL